MSDQVLTLELTNLYNDSKKKFPAVRAAAGTSLSHLKTITTGSQQDLASQLVLLPDFVEPCILACDSRNVKLACSAIICIQRLVASKGLPVTRLAEVLQALNQCVTLAFEVQLKILQVLPALAQNYAPNINGTLLSAALQVCAALQAVKTQTITGIATATFQQLVFSALDKVQNEDGSSSNVASVPLELDGKTYNVSQAAADAFRVISSIAASIEPTSINKPQFADLPQISALDTLWSCLHTYTTTFSTHPELIYVLRASLVPFLIRTLSERHSFPLTTRSMRLTMLVLQKQMQTLPEESEMLLSLLLYSLDPDAAPIWKRATCLELLRALFASPGLVLQIYMQYDQHKDKKPILRETIASFVRIATDNPALIGVAQHSVLPEISEEAANASKEQQAVEAAGGMVGVISSALAVPDADTSGIGMQWSVPRLACIDSLEKQDPPSLSPSYLYSLIIDCIGAIGDGMARALLPFTNVTEVSLADHPDEEASNEALRGETKKETRSKRSHSQRIRTLPINPLHGDTLQTRSEPRAIASFIESCWPAVLATTTTFLNANLDTDYHKAIVRSMQRFTQVAGLLELATARDAFLTALSKAALPANPAQAASPPPTIRSVSSSFYRNPKALLSLDSIAGTLASEPGRRPSGDANQVVVLSGRNLVCLRAMLNLAIAVGPLLRSAVTIILQTLQQADVLMALMQATPMIQSVANEIAAANVASKRLLALTPDFPNDAFVQFLQVLCNMITYEADDLDTPQSSMPSSPSNPAHPQMPLVRMPTLYRSSSNVAMRDQDRTLILRKLQYIAEINASRFARYDVLESGWKDLNHTLVMAALSDEITGIRKLSAEILCRASLQTIRTSSIEVPDRAEYVQSVALSEFETILSRLRAMERSQAVDQEIQSRILAAISDVVELCSETLNSSWLVVLTALESVFVGAEDADTTNVGDNTSSIYQPISCSLSSADLGRLAFGITQLVCSDFLSHLPDGARTGMVHVLYRFASQKSDLNMSLTTVALYLDLSQLMLDNDTPNNLHKVASDFRFESSQAFVETLTRSQEMSSTVQWLILLYRLGQIVSDDRSEIRHSACQTLISILSRQAGSFTGSVWRLILHFLFEKIIKDSFAKSILLQDEPELISQHTTSKLLLDTISNMLSKHSTVLQTHPEFVNDWSSFLTTLRQGLTMHSFVVDAAVFRAIAVLLHSLDTAADSGLHAAELAMSLWFDSVHELTKSRQRLEGEQDALVAYCACASEFHNILQTRLSVDQVAQLSDNLVTCISTSRVVPYGGDSRVMAPFQSSVMALLRSLKQDVVGIPGSSLRVITTLISMPYDMLESKFSFVAMAKEAMGMLVNHIQTHAADHKLLSSKEVPIALGSLNEHIRRKYQWQDNGSSPTLWRVATSSALAILPLIINSSVSTAWQDVTRLAIWSELVGLARNISCADLSSLTLPASYDHVLMVEKDEDFDRDSLDTLQQIIGLSLGDQWLPDSLRLEYMADLFRASIIHADDLIGIKVHDTAPLSGVLKVRRGRVHDDAASRREDLAFSCYKELIKLSCAAQVMKDDAEKGSRTTENEHRRTLAMAAAPFLIARFALPLKSYLADQPLRGACPTPISKVEELLWTLEQMESLCLHPDALKVIQVQVLVVESEIVDTVKRTAAIGRSMHVHLDILYSLLVRMVAFAGHQLYGNRMILKKVSDILAKIGSLS